ncbi:hypothetical protein CA850_07265 [Micromonospora echinospora]|uniref:DUF4349 domain-containing protein n=1 Tax=Micromonospora echinospora TaxID=1877 RepID=A0A1C4VDK1_MICEC|nr:DUF4349 domain-containing protein [Micromonospora echinospora]OZV83267.1 hypothetical protein CA850_07265 [Micromonospora echinospora]SCE82067.1 protein of unknown function [Micromonospora echinospora]
MVDNGRRRWGAPLVALGLVALVAVGGCSADRGSDSERAASDNAAGGAPAPAAPEAGRDAAGSDAAPGGAGGVDLRVDQRAIVYTGSVRVQVDDVDRAAQDTVALVTAAGGFVGGDERRGVDEDARAQLELRVPAARFTGVVDGIAKLGEQQWREIRTEDVTEQTVDLDARITTQRARVESARRLLARASSISDLVQLENELGRREADLASLEAKKRRLADLTALSTINVSLVTENTRTSDTDETGFLAGLASGWRTFLDSVTVLVTVLGALLPWLVVLAVPVVLVWRLARRRRQRRGAQVVPGAPAYPMMPGPVPAGVGAAPRPAPPAQRSPGSGTSPRPATPAPPSTGGGTPPSPGGVSESPPAP